MNSLRTPGAALLLGCSLVLTTPATATALPDAPCRIVSSQRVELASQTAGVLSTVLVDRGDHVHRGQLLAQLHAEIEQAQLQQAQIRTQGVGQLHARRAKQSLTQRALDRNADLRGRNFISAQDYDQLSTDRDIAAYDADTAAEALAEARVEVQSARAALAVRDLHSPIDGVVTERGLNPGERVADKPVLVLEQLDPLYAEVQLPASMLTRVHVGGGATLDLSDIPGLAPRHVRISLIDPAVDPKSGTLGVRFTIANTDGSLPSGIKCRIDIEDLK